MKKSYFDKKLECLNKNIHLKEKKLELLERDVIVKEKIASLLQILVEKKNIYVNDK